MDWSTALLAAPALGAFGMTAFNMLTWPRGRPSASDDVAISILIPARNEEASIEACVRSALAQPYVREVLVYDDQSTDATPDILAAIAADDSRVRRLQGVALPKGWVGKPHACHRLAEAAGGELLFFVDADVELEADAVARMLSLLADYDADAVTAVPAQRTGSFVERLVLPLLHLTYVSWLPLPLIWRSDDARFLAANGQLLLTRRTAYDSAGGFEAVRDAVVDDMALCRRLKQSGHTVVFADGTHIARCRMYGNATEVWEGFSKNLFEGIGSVTGLLAALTLYFAAFLLPWLLGLAAFAVPTLAPAALLGIGANVAQRALLTARYHHPLESIVLHPLSIVAFFAIALNSWIWHLRGAIRWSGRSYERQEARRG